MSTEVKRFVQIYTGNGKGKTTAAIGQVIRAAGAGLRTHFTMLMKEYPYSEVAVLKHLSRWITLEQVGDDTFVLEKRPPSEKDRSRAAAALEQARMAMLSGEYDIIVLDEVCVAHYFKLVSTDALLRLLTERPPEVELILTGRYCPAEWRAQADLVTEMTEEKHYYSAEIGRAHV